MIAALFLPEKFRHKRILAQRILGLSIQDDEIKAALIYAKRGGTIIESLASYAIETETGETIAQKTTAALRKCIAQMPRFDQVCISIPSSLIIFKSLQIRFIDREKIRMVLDYEVESMLPFAIDDALIDFIVTKENTEQQTSHVLVAAIRKSDLQDVLTLYNDAGIDLIVFLLIFLLCTDYIKTSLNIKTFPADVRLLISRSTQRVSPSYTTESCVLHAIFNEALQRLQDISAKRLMSQ